MSWKKNVFSCLMWMVYLLIVGTAMIFTGRVVCDSFGMADYFEIVIPAAYLLLTGILVSALHRMAVKLGVGSRGVGKGLTWLAWIEGILVFGLFAAGIFLRVTELRSEAFVMPDESVYLELSHISADGQDIPQFSHGAVYLYLWALRLCFILLGNKAAAAVWLQIALQMFSVLLLHFAVRKMAGRIPAVIMAAFFMLSPYMVEKALSLSPEMLYLLAFSLVLLFISQGVRYAPGWGFWLVAGALAAVLGYLDVAGFLLLPLMLGVIVMRRPDARRKIAGGLSGCLIGFLTGAVGCVLADMMVSGKPVSGIIRAWGNLYRWGGLQLSVTISSFDTVWMILLILCFMAWGIFSFWCSRGTDRFTAWIFCLCIAVLLQCLGIFTEEMNGFCYIFLFSTVLAGLGIRESMAVYPTKLHEEETTENEDVTEDIQEETTEDGEVTEDIQEERLIRRKPDGGLQSMTDEKVQAGKEQKYPMTDDSSQSAGNRIGNSDAEAPLEISEDKTRNREERGIVKDKDKTESKGGVRDRDKTESKDSIKDRNNTGGETEEKETKAGKEGIEEKTEKRRKIEFLENPLPLPKKHEKRVMDYKLNSDKDLGGYDIAVADDDDFDH